MERVIVKSVGAGQTGIVAVDALRDKRRSRSPMNGRDGSGRITPPAMMVGLLRAVKGRPIHRPTMVCPQSYRPKTSVDVGLLASGDVPGDDRNRCLQREVARGTVRLAEVLEFGLLVRADVLCSRASRAESAARWGIDRRGEFTLDLAAMAKA